MDSQYDAARELASLVKHELFPGSSSVPAFYLTKPNGTCGYQVLEATGAMEKLLYSEPPLFVSGSAGILGLRALLNSVELLDKQTAFEDCLKESAAAQRESVLDGIVDVTREAWQAAVTQLQLSEQEASALFCKLDNELLIASFDSGERA